MPKLKFQPPRISKIPIIKISDYFLKILSNKLPLFLFFIFLTAQAPVVMAEDYGDALVTASISDARTLIPILASDSASAEICGLLFNGLVKFDKDLNLVGDLAERWEVDNDGLVIIFHLRKNVFWHDGVLLTAKDVEFTYQKLIDPKVRTPYSADFLQIKSLEVLDDYTVKITYKEPFAPALSSWGMSIMPRHILEKEDLNHSSFSRNPVGCGPYKFKKWNSQQKIELCSNHQYFEKRPYIDRYVYRIIPDESTIFLELQSQGIDYSGLSPLQFLRQTDTPKFKRNFRKFRLPGYNYTYLGYNLKNPKFQDVRVRKALNLAVDKNEIIKSVLLGYGKITTGPFIPESWAYNPNVLAESYNPQLAKKLLADAGIVDSDKDGWLEKDGKRFMFTIVTNQGNEERLKVAQIIQRRLREIGVEVKIKVVEWSIFLSEYIDKRNFEAVLLGWSLPRDPDNYDIWHSSKTKEGEFNFVGFENEQVDKLLVEARRTFDQSRRAECYHRIHEIIYDQQPYMFLYAPDTLVALHNRFQGIAPALAGISYNFIYWWVPKNQQRYATIQP